MLTKEQRDEILRRCDEIAKAPTLIKRLSLADCLDSITVPEGWQIVPTLPTVDMRTAGAKATDIGNYSPVAVWAAMLAAAPKPGDSNE